MKCVLLIATRKYKQFVPEIVRQIDRFFLPDEEVGVMIFSDEHINLRTTERVNVIWTRIEELKWPFATLYRYRVFSRVSEYLKKFSHLFYLDADTSIIDVVGEEILVDGLMAVRHPGFWASDGWGSEGNPETSTSWFPAEQRKHYWCGGTQGGKSEHYLEACKVLADRIDEDEKNGVRAVHNDETHWNKWCNVDRPELVYEFDSGYCMVEEIHLRNSWGLSNLKPRILALSKNHKEMRE